MQDDDDRCDSASGVPDRRGHAWIKALAKTRGCAMRALLAMSKNRDPYATGTPAHWTRAEWFHQLWQTFGYTRRVHLRRIHYQLVSQRAPRKADGTPYENTERDWEYLQQASVWARYLGLVDPRQIIDHRNPAPHLPPYLVTRAGTIPMVVWDEEPPVWDLPTIPTDLGALLAWDFPEPTVIGYEYDAADQPYHLEIWVEKSTMNDILLPIAERYHAVLVASVGFQSVTSAVDLVAGCVALSGKPVRIFYLSDFDPAGDAMAPAIARQIEFWRARAPAVGRRVAGNAAGTAAGSIPDRGARDAKRGGQLMTRTRRGLVRAGLCAILVGYGSLLAAVPAGGHAFAPALLEVRETTPGQARVRWKQPAVRASGSGLVPLMSAGCRARGEPQVSEEDTGVVATWEIDCAGGLVGQTLRVDGIAASQANVLLRLVLADGRVIRHVLTAEQPYLVVPAREGALAVLASYGRLGIEHILTGSDHLLFVLGLVLLVGGGRRLLETVTAFTLGHSVTLALAVLGLVRVPQPPIEVGIACSIYVLAVELVPRASRKPTLLTRAPWLMAGLFGLLHGLGFAGALAQVGLPQGDIPLAFFAFNMGIEAGQLVFVGLVLAVWAAVRALPVRWPARAAYVPAYAMGTLAAFWVFQRLAASLPGFR